MKQLLITFLLCFLANTIDAQIGHGIEFSYNPAGYRVKREYSPTASLYKTGTNSDGQKADTIIGAYKKGNIENNILVKIYPNPVHEMLFVENVSWVEGNVASLAIFDVSGKQVIKKDISTAKETVNMSELVPGTYHLTYFVNNVHFVSWKIVKL